MSWKYTRWQAVAAGIVILFAAPLLAQAAGPELSTKNVRARQLTDNGGRVDWYKGEKHDLIAFDAVTGKRPFSTELYTVRPDGSEKRCVTCNLELPTPVRGQPAWHPDGEYILIQVYNGNAQRETALNHMSFGFENDLYLVSRDGKEKRRIWQTPQNHAALHPHFSKDGRQLLFSERQMTGESRWFLKRLTPGGENHWTGWRMHLADFKLNRSGEAELSNHREIQPNGDGFYETHGFSPDGRILYSFTPGGKAYVDDIYSCKPDGSDVRRLTRSSETWDEHGLYSPDGGLFAFVSSRVDPSLKFPRTPKKKLITELYIQRGDSEPVQVTNMNERRKAKTVVSDFSWSRDGRHIVAQVAPWEGDLNPQLWILDLPE